MFYISICLRFNLLSAIILIFKDIIISKTKTFSNKIIIYYKTKYYKKKWYFDFTKLSNTEHRGLSRTKVIYNYN